MESGPSGPAFIWNVDLGLSARENRGFCVSGGQMLVEERRSSAASDAPGVTAHTHCRNPIQFSDTTSEFPGFCGSYFTDVCSPNRQECRLIQCLR